MSIEAPGQILSGKYRLERELGRGGMGSVWLGQHLTLRSPVAIKLIDPQIAQSPDALSRFLREAQSAASLRSPHVVQILDHGVDQGVPFIAMELLDGESLATRLTRVRRLSPAETAHFMTHVARAMTKAHEAGIVHRDLKPDNIFIVRNDEEEIAKVLDFGIAKSRVNDATSLAGATRTGSVLGTPHYMSPEQAEGAKAVDHRTDIWAMGVIAWECVVGARPFEAETLGGLLLAICARDLPTPSRMGPVPPGFDAWFARACARDVNQRFSTAKEAAQVLRSVCTGEPIGGGAAWPVSQGPDGVAASQTLPSTTAHLSLSSASQTQPKNSLVPWLGFGLLALTVVGGGTVFALRGSTDAEQVTSAEAPAAATPSVPPAGVSPAGSPLPDLRSEASASQSAQAPSVVPAPSVSTPPVASVAPAAPKRVSVKQRPQPSAPVPEQKPAVGAEPSPPAPSPPRPAPKPKPGVNLGI